MNLKDERKKINEIDRKILFLLNQRINVSKAIAKIKLEKGLPVFLPEIESKKINALKKENKKINSGFSEKTLEAIFKEIFSAGKKIQKNLIKGEEK
ncbi:MAG TPA: chorismate mutase [archaeon]|nr:chorismate mutase [archaeon]